MSSTHKSLSRMPCTRKSTSRKSAKGRNPRQLIADMYQDRLLMLRLKHIEIPSLPGSIGIQRGDILGRTPHRTLLHPLNEDVIDCGIAFENAGDQIPNHLLRVPYSSLLCQHKHLQTQFWHPAIAMSFCTHSSAICIQSYGKFMVQLWHIFA
jgi:hypothetical protein